MLSPQFAEMSATAVRRRGMTSRCSSARLMRSRSVRLAVRSADGRPARARARDPRAGRASPDRWPRANPSADAFASTDRRRGSRTARRSDRTLHFRRQRDEQRGGLSEILRCFELHTDVRAAGSLRGIAWRLRDRDRRRRARNCLTTNERRAAAESRCQSSAWRRCRASEERETTLVAAIGVTTRRNGRVALPKSRALRSPLHIASKSAVQAERGTCRAASRINWSNRSSVMIRNLRCQVGERRRGVARAPATGGSCMFLPLLPALRRSPCGYSLRCRA